MSRPASLDQTRFGATLSRRGSCVCVALAASGLVVLSAMHIDPPRGSDGISSARRASLQFEARTGSSRGRMAASAAWEFEPNVGQANPQVRFLARARDASIFLTEDSLYVSWAGQHRVANSGSPESVSIRFEGSNRGVKTVGQDQQPGKTNYFVGRNPSAWHVNVPHYSSVECKRLYSGIDAQIYGSEQGLEYDLTAHRPNDVERIWIRIRGAKLSLDAQRNLVMHAGKRTLLMKRPRIYQIDDGTERTVRGRYEITAGGEVKFAIGKCNPDLPVVIDPIISVAYTTFLGGAGAEKGSSVATDASGKIYVGGTTALAVFPADSTPAILGANSGNSVLFVAKIDSSLSGAASLDYLTFISGSGVEHGGMIAVDNSAVPPRLAVLGWTTSTDFPVTDNSLLNGLSDLTVTELNGTGSALVYSKYFGGSGAEASQNFGAITSDSAGNVFVTSDTTSADMPIANSFTALQPIFGGGASDGFLAEFAAGSSTKPGALLYSTYFGINAQAGSTGIALDSAGQAYISGFTSSPLAFPLKNAVQSSYGGGALDAFVMEINPAASGTAGLIYSSLIGGSGSDQALSIKVDASLPANAYIVGATQSPDLISAHTVTNSPLQSSLNGNTAGFVAVINQSTGTPALQYLTFLGGTKSDQVQSIAVISSTRIYVAGTATSDDFPSLCSLQPFSGTQDAFVSEFDPSVSGNASLLSATFLGGTSTAGANGVAADSLGDAVVFGDTLSADFPLAGNPQNGVQPICASCQSLPAQSDAFLTVLKANTNPTGCVAFNPAVANLGSFADATSSPPLNILLTNSGSAALNITGMTVTGANSGDFVLSNNSCLVNSPVASGSFCNFSITFAPSVIGLETASVQVTDDGIGSPQGLILRGTGTGFGITLNPASLSFPDTAQGTVNPNSLTVTLTNTGSNELAISAGPQITGINAVDFVVASSSTCTVAALPTFVPGATCTIVVQFEPGEPNPPMLLSAQTVVTLTDPASQAGETVSIPLSGTEVAVAPAIAFSPVALNFSSENVGSLTAAQSITVTNDGSAPLAIANISIAGANAADFSETNNCPVAPATLAVNVSCTISAKFQPTVAGARAAAISVTDNASGSPQSIPLTGAGTATGVSLTPPSLTFSADNVGSVSTPQSVTLQNTGTGPLTISSISFTGANASDFSEKNNCPAGPVATLVAGLSCAIEVTFDPAGTGSRTASLSISDDAASSPQSVALAGTGTAPAVQFSAASLNFAPTLINTSSGNSPIQVTNSGNGPLVITQVGFAGANPSDFHASGSCTGASGASVSVAAGSNCEIDVNFDPTAAGARNAALSVTDNAAGSPQQVVQLSGAATDFQLQPADGGSASAAIKSGATASFNMQIASVNGFSGTPSLSCTNSVPGATCTVTPAQVAVAPNQSAPFAVTITTTAPSIAFPSSPGRQNRLRLFLFAAFMLTLFTMVLAVRKRPRMRLVTVFALASGFLVCSCGMTSGTRSVSGTPAGNYTLTINGASSGATRTATLSLTVQ